MLLEKEQLSGFKDKNPSGKTPRAYLRDACLPKRGIKVLLADDHKVVRQGLSTLLKLNADIEVVGEAPDGESAVCMTRELNPDVVLMDINMPKMNGVEATRIIHSESPHVRIVGLSMYDKDAFSDAMMEAGASAYCTKGCEMTVLMAAIRGKAEEN